jgi:hypothetical protein
LSKKRQFFRIIFGENILKIITSVPESRSFFVLFCRKKLDFPASEKGAKKVAQDLMLGQGDQGPML